jgi:hypothetical protein
MRVGSRGVVISSTSSSATAPRRALVLGISVLRILLAVVRRWRARWRWRRWGRELVLLVPSHLPSTVQHLAGRVISTGPGFRLLLGLRLGVLGFLATGSKRFEVLVLRREV